MLDDDDRHPLLFENCESATHVGDGLGVQVRRRFIGEEDRRPGGKRTGECYFLELAARQARQFPVHQVRDTHELGGACAGLDQSLSIATVVLPAEGQLLGDGVTEELCARVLEDRRAQVTDLGQGDLGKVAPINPHAPFELPRGHLWDEAGERPHERRLPAPGRPAHEGEGSRPGGQIDPTQGFHSVPRQITDVGE